MGAGADAVAGFIESSEAEEEGEKEDA